MFGLAKASSNLKNRHIRDKLQKFGLSHKNKKEKESEQLLRLVTGMVLPLLQRTSV